MYEFPGQGRKAGVQMPPQEPPGRAPLIIDHNPGYKS